MGHLPFEILEYVISKLDKQESLACLTVNKAWYSVVIKFIYTKIIIDNPDSLKLLLKALSQFPRCIEAARHLKHLNITVESASGDLIIKESFIHAMKNCPSIEYLEMNGDDINTQTLMDPRMPALPNLGQLELTASDSSISKEYFILNCLYKYRKQLTTLIFDYNKYPATTSTHENVVSYVTQFPCLTTFKYYDQSDDSSKDITHVIDQILSRCTKLNKLELRHIRLVLPGNDTSNQKYPMIENLILSNAFSHVQTSYIKTRFPNLREINISNKEITDDYSVKIRDFLGMQKLSDFQLSTSGTMTIDILTAFYALSHRIYYSAFKSFNKASFIYDISPPLYHNLQFKKCHKTKTTKTSIKISCSAEDRADYLKEIGSTLDDLELSDATLDFGAIQKLCPKLSVLLIDSCNLTECTHLTIPNANLSRLELSNATLDMASFKEIEVSFPKLQELRLHAPVMKYESVENPIYMFTLPDTGLKYIELNEDIAKWTDMNFMVLKEVDGVPVRSWHICKESLKVVTSESESITSRLKQKHDLPLFVFKSSTIRKVSLETANDFTDSYVLNK